MSISPRSTADFSPKVEHLVQAPDCAAPSLPRLHLDGLDGLGPRLISGQRQFVILCFKISLFCQYLKNTDTDLRNEDVKLMTSNTRQQTPAITAMLL